TVAIHPQDTSRVFAVSDGGGIYRSRNSGANWELIIKGLTSLDILSVAVHPQDTSKIILSSAAGIFKSLDGGDSWFSTGDIPTDVVISMLVIDPLTPDHVVAATTSGIYHSEDLGDSWIEKNNLPLEFLLVAGSFSFETWQDSTVVIAPFNSTTMDTTIIFPYIYERALAAWIAGGMKGEPPVDANPLATKMVFIPGTILPPSTKIQVRVKGSFESDRETLRDSYGAEDVNGNSLELDYNFSFTTSKN
ncbi:MAG: WD40/YVTN/BNR-like repeat-containing protein, partial [bacterium]